MGWFIKKVAVNTDTGQQMHVWCGTSEWDYSLYPTYVFEYFKAAPIYNIFTLMFPKIETSEEDMRKSLMPLGQEALRR